MLKKKRYIILGVKRARLISVVEGDLRIVHHGELGPHSPVAVPLCMDRLKTKKDFVPQCFDIKKEIYLPSILGVKRARLISIVEGDPRAVHRGELGPVL